MFFSNDEVFDFVNENDVKFIKLAFCDVFGNQKNISIVISELNRALTSGISIDASAVKGFGSEEKSDLFLFPDITTLSLLPWRPARGRVARFYCNIKYPDGRQFELDSRYILQCAQTCLKERNLVCNIGAEAEFYLFTKDEFDNPSNIPFDKAGYLSVAPDDKGEDVRREICLTLESMSIFPESSHHEEGPGQNEIDFRYSNPLSAADNIQTVKTVVKTIASQSGLFASFDPKPLENKPGSGLHINLSVHDDKDNSYLDFFVAGIMKRIKDITLFLNPSNNSYKRLGCFKAPHFVTWSAENRSQLIRIPAGSKEYHRLELRSPDPLTNPYISYALLIYAGLEGIDIGMKPVPPVDKNLYKADKSFLDCLETLPSTYDEALNNACNSDFVNKYLPSRILDAYKGKNDI